VGIKGGYEHDTYGKPPWFSGVGFGFLGIGYRDREAQGGIYYVYSAYCAGLGRIHGAAIHEVIPHTLLGFLMMRDIYKNAYSLVLLLQFSSFQASHFPISILG
jgi:hypothetical protein